MLQNTRIKASTVFELLRETQQGGWWGGGNFTHIKGKIHLAKANHFLTDTCFYLSLLYYSTRNTSKKKRKRQQNFKSSVK